ncbi:MAG: hypothetical protein DMG50_05565 [Acidobacteria bacterium]|nr:MAG: hypothetical protein DMG50_05565 [Acidobacteriota bacterium]
MVWEKLQSDKTIRREAKAASALNHPNICTIYDVGEDKAQAFMAMEYLEGTTLKHRISSRPMERGPSNPYKLWASLVVYLLANSSLL